MKRCALLLSLLFLSTSIPLQANWWGIWSQGSGYVTNSAVKEIYNAIVHMTGRSHSQETLNKLWTLAHQIHSQIQENARTFRVPYDQIKNDTIINCFLEHIKVAIEIEARAEHFSGRDAKNIAQTFLHEQKQTISRLCPHKSEITSPYDLPAGIFAPLVGDSLNTKVQSMVVHYRTASSQISWGELLLAAGLIVLDTATRETSTSPSYYPTPPQTPPPSFHEPVPAHRSRPTHTHTTPPAQTYEEGGLPKIRPDECSLMCYEDFGTNRERIFCPFCGKPACKPCWQGNMHYGRYCGQGCFDSSSISTQLQNFWKTRLKKVINDSTTYCALCNKSVEGMQKLRNCTHQMCAMCQGMWASLQGDYSEYCPRCTKPLV